jgi:hypothetical protein
VGKVGERERERESEERGCKDKQTQDLRVGNLRGIHLKYVCISPLLKNKGRSYLEVNPYIQRLHTKTCDMFPL